MKYKVRFTYVATDNTEHTMEAKFSSFQLAMVKLKSFSLKDNVHHIVKVEVDAEEE